MIRRLRIDPGHTHLLPGIRPTTDTQPITNVHSEKAADHILIIPTTDRTGRWYGNEYLQLYRRIDEAKDGKLGVWSPDQTTGVYLATL